MYRRFMIVCWALFAIGALIALAGLAGWAGWVRTDDLESYTAIMFLGAVAAGTLLFWNLVCDVARWIWMGRNTNS